MTVPDSTWDSLAACETSSTWDLNLGTGVYGGLNVPLALWQAAGGEGLPHEHTREEQIVVANEIFAQHGWAPWPNCSLHVRLTLLEARVFTLEQP